MPSLTPTSPSLSGIPDAIIETPEFEVHYHDEQHVYVLRRPEPQQLIPGISTLAKEMAEHGWRIPWARKVAIQDICQLQSEGFNGRDYEEWTTLLKEKGLTAYAKRDKAGDRGTEVHSLIEEFWQTKVARPFNEVSPEALGYYRSFLLWHQEENPECLAAEVMVASGAFRFAGTYDARVLLGDQLALIDFKTSAKIGRDYHYQLAGYELAAVECGAEETDAQYIIHLRGDGKKATVEQNVCTEDDFIVCLNSYRSKQEVDNRRKEQRKRIKEAA